MGQLTDCQIVEAFMKATARRYRPGYISMDELYTQVRTKVRVSIEDSMDLYLLKNSGTVKSVSGKKVC